ncbi:STAS domain-containing protein [Actinoplanes sp. CA-054009]
MGEPSVVTIDEHGGVAVVRIRGGIDAAAAPVLRDALSWAVDCHQRVVVDLSGAVRIDRAGLSVLLVTQDRANGRAVQLCFTAPSPSLLSILSELRAEDLLAAVDPPSPMATGRAARRSSFSLPRPHRLALGFAADGS